jgi:hypothetical protein
LGAKAARFARESMDCVHALQGAWMALNLAILKIIFNFFKLSLKFLL